MDKEKGPLSDPSQNFFTELSQPLDSLFKPKSIALIGAKDTKGSVGRTLFDNLDSFPGKFYPINPKRTEILGKKCYSSISSIQGAIDLAIIVTPANTVPSIVKECVKHHIPSIIIISAGFKELGPSGQELENQIQNLIKNSSTQIIGPNCLGLMNPHARMNATFAATDALPGNIAFISQSGAMCTAVLDWSLQQNIGFSAFVSIGSMLDIHWGDLIDYLGNDPNTHSILIYMETIGDARAFLSAARKVTLSKPIIVIKAGRTEAAAKAAASHTGSLAGSDEVFEVAMQRAGVLRVNTIEELFNIALALGKQPLTKGPRLTIITNAGGPAVLATDNAVSQGALMAELSHKTIEQLNTFLPAAWSHSNPVDILGDASAETYAKTIEEVSKDPHTDGILVILSPQDMTDPTKTAEYLKNYNQLSKPVFASWMGGSAVSKGAQILNAVGIPTFAYPDSASKVFANMWHHRHNIQDLYQTPAIRDDLDQSASLLKHQKVETILQEVRRHKRTILTEQEAKQVLSCYNIPTVETILCETPEKAGITAERLGFPVVVKLHSHTITHKSDVGGVRLNLHTKEEVVQAFHDIHHSVSKVVGVEHFHGVVVQQMIQHKGYELILGSTTDVQFGPVILFGAGGVLVEIFKDRALALPPLNATLAKRLMEKTKIFHALHGIRGEKSIDIQALEKILISFSQLVVEHSWIKECDINPLKASPSGIIALDARIVLHDLDIKENDIPKVAIRPYPNEHILHLALENETPVTFRPIRPEDEPLIIEFHKSLSEDTIFKHYQEFISLNTRVAHERLVKVCCIDYDRDIRIIAEYRDPQTHQSSIIGIGRILRLPTITHGQFQLIIVDRFHHMGLGKALMNHLLTVAQKEHFTHIESNVLAENTAMLAICKSLNFSTAPSPTTPHLIHVQKKL